MTTLVEDDLRTRVNEDPVYAAEVAKLNSFKLELSELDAQISGANMELADARREGGLNAAADRLLAGDSTDTDELIKRLSESQEGMRRRFRVLTVVVERQRKIAGEALSRVSIAICEEHKPEHEAVVRQLAEALVVAAQAAEREHEFRDRLKQAGIFFSGTLRPMPFRDLRDPVDYSSMLANWFRSGVNQGPLSVDDVPTEWREGWGLK